MVLTLFLLGTVEWGGMNNDILFISTFNAVRNITTGVEVNVTLSEGSGRVYMVYGLKSKGRPGRPVSLSTSESQVIVKASQKQHMSCNVKSKSSEGSCCKGSCDKGSCCKESCCAE